MVVDLREEEVSVREREGKGEGSAMRKFEGLSAIHDLLKKIMIGYAKNESILKLIGRWFEDVAQVIATAYFVIDNLKVNNQLSSSESRYSCSKVLDSTELLKFQPLLPSFSTLSFEQYTVSAF
jgi:chromosome condensin MukBEF complex kleisin-like MukF subunit